MARAPARGDTWCGQCSGLDDNWWRSGRRECPVGIAARVSQVPEPRRRVPCSYRSHGVQHEPESHNAAFAPCGADVVQTVERGRHTETTFLVTRVGVAGIEPATSALSVQWAGPLGRALTWAYAVGGSQSRSVVTRT